jgi:hypothetical protein
MASLGIHHGVSFIKPKEPKYNSKYHHRNILPLKNIALESLTPEANSRTFKDGYYVRNKKASTLSLEDLLLKIKPEYRDLL